MRVNRASSLRARVLVLIVLALVPALAYAIVTANEGRRIGREEATADALRLARLIAASQQALVEGARQLLVTLADVPAVRGGGALCGRTLARMRDDLPQYANFFVADADGDLMCSAEPIDRPVTFGDRAWFRRVLSTRRFAIGDYQIGRITNAPVVVAASPVTDGGRIRAVVGASIRLGVLQDLLERIAVAPGSSISIIDQGGTVLARRPDAGRFVGLSFPDRPLIQAMLRGEGISDIEGLDGVRRLFAYTPAAAADGQRVTIVSVGVPRAVAFANTDRILRRQLTVLAILAVAGLAVALAVARLLVLRPAHAVVVATRRLAGGDLSARVGPPYPRNELGELARSFDAMAETLQTQEVERHRADEHRVALEDRLQRSARLESLGQLAGGVAHDFNNLLTVILLYARFVEQALPDDHPARADVAEIHRAAMRAADLTRQLLIFGRREVSEPEVLDVSAVLRDMETLLRRTIGEQVELSIDASAGGWRVEVDPGQLEQVVVNLAVNARDAMPAGGTITIVASNEDLTGEALPEGSDLAPGRYVRLSVSDSGVGMPPDVIERAFEPFFTTKPKGQGTGLGLSTVFGVVRGAGGDLVIRSTPGAGTTVDVFLPVSEREPRWRAPDHEADPHHSAGQRILLAEDEVAVRDLTRRILERHGYEVLAADGPEHALELLGSDDHVDLLLTDVVMPRMTGRELADKVAARSPGVRVLFMSGYPDEVLGNRDAPTGGIELLRKPFTEAQLLDRVRDVLRTRP